MPELRISDIAAMPGQRRRVEVTWWEGAARRVAVANVSDGTDRGDGELVRWYLEDYAEYPADPAPALAASAERTLFRDGTDLFQWVFSGQDAAGIWERARDRLGEVRVEVEADPGDGPGLAWELLRDPGRDAAIALEAGAFVRTHLQAAGHPDLPEPSGDRLRVLLVICRPGGRDDVPFRSVASRLVRGGAERMARLDLDVLRPATFAQMSKTLHAAKAAGRPYHVVHFDGHGTYLDVAELGLGADGNDGAVTGDGNGTGVGGIDLSPLRYEVSVAGPVRPGQHGYLLFEAPTGTRNVQLVDGPTLGRLLMETGVPVLVLNACRSAYSEARSRPADDNRPPKDGGGSAGRDVLEGDVHARIRAYGSLSAEVADTGVPGVVAMRYNVYVVTAAQFVADLYAHLLAGRSLGEAATGARRGLATNPDRQIGAVPVPLQDWVVPVIYESAPLVLLRPENRAVPVIRLSPGDGEDTSTFRHGGTVGGTGPDRLPRPPDAGFFGRDETLLALDRAFDVQRVVLLHAFAGAGKSSTAAEFARWYQATGGLDRPDHPEWGPGPALWSSFEHHLSADRAISMVGDYFSGLFEANGIAWAAVTNPLQRRDLVMQALEQVPVLWVWDNVEPVTGFPTGTPSVWTPAEQDDLAGLLRDLAQRTQCKVLLTSRRDEYGWLGDLAARVRLPPMPMRESLQLAAAIAARRGHSNSVAGTDWRPLLRFAAGNPLTITVVTGQALRENLTTTNEIAGLVARLRTGEAPLEDGQDTALGRARSLAVSLDYGFASAFTEAERAQLAVLHLFRDTVAIGVICLMGDPVLGENMVPELGGLDPATAALLLDRAAEIGLLSPIGGQRYQIHPALPWYFTRLFIAVYGTSEDSAAQRAGRAYAWAVAGLGEHVVVQSESGHLDESVRLLRIEEANLLHGLDRSCADRLWEAALGCMQGLRLLYMRTGRDSEWARLVADISSYFTDRVTGGPLPRREEHWAMITYYKARLAEAAHDWSAAVGMQNAIIAQSRNEAAEALTIPSTSLTPHQRAAVRNLAVALTDLGDILLGQGNPGCLQHYEEVLALSKHIGSREEESRGTMRLGSAYLQLPGLRDLGQAEHWFRCSLSLRAESDRHGRAECLGALADVAIRCFEEARAAGETGQSKLLQDLNAALRGYQEALALVPVDDHEARGMWENQLGIVYSAAGDTHQAIRHYQRSIQHKEIRGDIRSAGITRYNVALLLEDEGHIGEALRYAHAALDNFLSIGVGAAAEAARAENLIADLEQRAG